MKKLTPEQAWGRSGLMAVSAVRYCLGRRTYIVSDCQEWLCNIWDKLPEKAKAVIERDVEEAFKSDDEHRANGKDYRALGHDCDRRCWEQVRKLWRNNETRPVHKSAEVGRHLVSNPQWCASWRGVRGVVFSAIRPFS